MKGQFATVSEWMAHGTIMRYISENHANRLELVGILPSSLFPLLKYDNSYVGRRKG